MLSCSLPVVASLPDDEEDDEAKFGAPGSGPRVHRQSRRLFRRPATGVSGHESLSDSEESRLSPARAPPGRGEFSSDRKRALIEGLEGEDVLSEGGVISMDAVASDAVSESEEEVEEEASEEMVEQDDSMSECAMVYLTVLISSSSGVRKETLFSEGKNGRAEAILRVAIMGARLFRRMEVTLCGCL